MMKLFSCAIPIFLLKSAVEAQASTLCPLPGEASTPLDLSGGSGVNLAKSSAGQLCTLTELSSEGQRRPVGRSYNGRDWEVSAGLFDSFAFACTESACSID